MDCEGLGTMVRGSFLPLSPLSGLDRFGPFPRVGLLVEDRDVTCPATALACDGEICPDSARVSKRLLRLSCMSVSACW